jgi:hypothetical protein
VTVVCRIKARQGPMGKTTAKTATHKADKTEKPDMETQGLPTACPDVSNLTQPTAPKNAVAEEMERIFLEAMHSKLGDRSGEEVSKRCSITS